MAAHRTDRRTRARRRTNAIIETLESRRLLAITLSTSQWTPLGPAPQNQNWTAITPHQPTVSGRAVDVAVHPTDPNTIYVATAGGGVWKTTNGGAHWTPLTDHEATLFTGSVALAPSNPNVVYAGTGEALFGPSKMASGRSNIYYGRGVLRSTDGGASWSLKGSNLFDRRAISQVVVDPVDPNIVYAAVGATAINGVDGNKGIWKSTDGGDTWVNTTASIAPAGTAALSDLIMDPTNRQVLYAAIGEPGGNAINGVYKTTDGGATWALAGNFPTGAADTRIGRIVLALCDASPGTLYASIASSSSSNPSGFGIENYEIFKTTNSGASWTLLPQAPDFSGAADYTMDLAVDPANPNIVYAAGGGALYNFIRSTDGGNTWTNITADSSGVGAHTDHHDLVFDSNGKLLDTNDGGIWRLDNPNPGSLVWTDLNGDLNTIQLVGIAIDPFDPNRAFGGSQDNGIARFSGTTVWQDVLDFADGGNVRIDPNNPNIVYGSDAGYSPVSLKRSDDGGVTFHAIVDGLNFTDPHRFYVPFQIHPFNTDRLLLGSNRVYNTVDRGDHWTPISTPNTDGWNSSAPIDALAIGPVTNAPIYASAGGHVFVSTNSGITWQQRDIPGVTDRLSNLFVDSSGLVYAVRDKFDGGHAFSSADGGLTWKDITANLPNVPVNTVEVVNVALGSPGKLIFVGTDIGVYGSSDGGLSWSRYGDGMPNVQVMDLDYSFPLKTLAAGTHGRGMWEIRIQPLVVTNTNDSGAGSLRQAILDANANADYSTIYFDIRAASQTIRPATPLPQITSPVTIDGSTQGGFTGTPIARLDGATSSIAVGLDLRTNGSLIRGLSITNFTQVGIQFALASGNRIEGNFIGVAPDGVTAGSNRDGIRIEAFSAGNIIGGVGPQKRNVISGNSRSGVDVLDAGGGQNVMEGNFIGTNAAGTSAVPNGDGVAVVDGYQRIGGTEPGAGNLISGNSNSAISISAPSFRDVYGTVVQGNLIGTNASLTGTIPNNYGIFVSHFFDSTAQRFVRLSHIGGTEPGAGNVIVASQHSGIYINNLVGLNYVEGNFIGVDPTRTQHWGNADAGITITGGENFISGGNVIAFNGGNGVDVIAGTANSIIGNSIYSNTGLGIDLSANQVNPDGVTPNDAMDVDHPGGNHLQNFPVLNSVSSSAGTVSVGGTLNSEPNTFFTIQFYNSSAGDPSGYGEGENFLGSTGLVTDADGNASFTFNYTGPAQFITATTSGFFNETSEFSQGIGVSNLSASPGANYTLSKNSDGSQMLTINSGTVTINGSPPTSGPGLTVIVNGGDGLSSGGGDFIQSGGANVIFIGTQHLAGLTLNGDATARMPANGSWILYTAALAISPVARMDLTDNDLILNDSTGDPIGSWTGTSYTGVIGWIASGRNGGAWNGYGILTSALAGDHRPTLGIARASEVPAAAGGIFEGESVDPSTVLMKFTYGGDANLDGKINIDDYVRIDRGIAAGLTGWSNGDFTYDGVINIDDYVIIDFTLPIQDATFLTATEPARARWSVTPMPRLWGEEKIVEDEAALAELLAYGPRTRGLVIG